MVGRHQHIEVGPMSGASNVEYRLHALGIEPTPDRVKAVLVAAKKADEAMGGRATTATSDDAYREDLADVVRPRRPVRQSCRCS